MSDEGRTLPSYPDGSSVSEDAFRQRYLDAKFRTFNAQNGDAAPTRYTTFVRALKDIDQSEGSDSNQELLPLRVIKKGDVIEVVQRFSGEKWFGSLGSAFGFFPVNTGDVRPMVTAQVRAIWSSSYNSNPVDLLFEAGDTIDVIYPYDGGWWFWGHISGHVGLFPFNFVESIPEAGKMDLSNPTESGVDDWDVFPSLLHPSTPRQQVRALYEAPTTEPIDLPFAKSDLIEVLSKFSDDWWLGLIGERVGIFPTNYVSHTEPSVRKCPPWSPYFVRAEWTFEAKDLTEINIRCGEVIEVLEMTYDMWWSGRTRDGKKGFFPINYVKPILSRHQCT